MKAKKTNILAVATGLLIAGLAVVASVATANANERAVPKGAVENGGSLWYTVDAIEGEWPGLIDELSGDLPGSVEFPDRPFQFFYQEPLPGEGGNGLVYFEEGIADQLVARYWRCAWLDESLDGPRSASARSEAAAHLANTAPIEEANGVDFASYEAAIAREASASGMSATQFEFDIECGFFVSEGVNR